MKNNGFYMDLSLNLFLGGNMMKLYIFILLLVVLSFDIFVVMLISNHKKSKAISLKVKFLGLSLEFKIKK